ncbi:MAG: hypothetical protein K9J37_16440 [Saprospiraceae bacterium]|nr:hypothetical protein [Saprospiraceae bacterium]MCF8251503.1 hypothetical protein [Saprospiraceae bacterium]MCF8280754.1 hypothetical protein [Bacteroidales bacterium]MCF8313363.1 hypothetical protein [Saprospiraceae bacterium]MCF8441817.1 hypothetical protein [Saprospiraceae bacterium]
MIQRILAYHLAFLILFTNIGVPVFTHVCNGQGKVWTSVLGLGSSCCSKKKATKAKVCHLPNQATKKKGIQPKPCCENKVTFQHQQSEFSNDIPSLEGNNFQKAVLPTITGADFNSFSWSSDLSISFQPHAPPVQLHGRSLLIFEQVFIC